MMIKRKMKASMLAMLRIKADMVTTMILTAVIEIRDGVGPDDDSIGRGGGDGGVADTS